MNEITLSNDDIVIIKLMIMDILETYEYNPYADNYLISDCSSYYDLPSEHIEKIKELARKIMKPYEKHLFGNLIYD